MKFKWFRKMFRGRLLYRTTEEDRVLDLLLQYNAQPCIEYFSTNEVRFIERGRSHFSPSGRVEIEKDIYTYVRVDGKDLDKVSFNLPYEARRTLVKQLERAFMSNILGYVAYEERYFPNKGELK